MFNYTVDMLREECRLINDALGISFLNGSRGRKSELASSITTINLDSIKSGSDSGRGSNLDNSLINRSMDNLQHKKQLFQNKVLDNRDLGNSQDNDSINISQAIEFINDMELKDTLDKGDALKLFNINRDCLEPILNSIEKDIDCDKEWSEEELEYNSNVIYAKKRVLKLQKNKPQIDDNERLCFDEELEYLNNLEEYIKRINKERQKDFEEEQDPSSEELSDSGYTFKNLPQKELFSENGQFKGKRSNLNIPNLNIQEQCEQERENAKNIQNVVEEKINQLMVQQKYGQAQKAIKQWNSFVEYN